MRVVAVNGRRFSADQIRDAVRATKSHPDLEVIVENGDYFRTLHLQYRGGARYPALERNPAQPDRLEARAATLGGRRSSLRPRAAYGSQGATHNATPYGA